jgi:nicotinate-nucleotide adenylyltransferase
MPKLEQAVGILGGTFDPVHFGHLRMALELYQALDLAHVRLIPCYQPVHRKQPVATPEQRLAMVQKAITSEPALCVDDCEIQRKGPSYTIDTLNTLQTTLPNTPLCIFMGIDALLNFPSWHKWENILQLAHLVVAHRPQYQLLKTGIVANLLKERLTENAADLHKHAAGRIFLHPVTSLEISSTDIRKQIAMGGNPRYLLPNNVYHYIKQHGTYSINKPTS